jgi:hypothetical protein
MMSRAIQQASNSRERIENRSHDRSGDDIEVTSGFSPVRDSAASHGAVRPESHSNVTGQSPRQEIPIERLRARFTQSELKRRPVMKRAFGATLNSKSAIVSTEPVHSKIVVVPAEQARRERERVALCAVHRLRAATGLTGKAAFEALFKDGSTPKTMRD